MLQQNIIHIPRSDAAAYNFMMGLAGPYIDSDGSGWQIRQIIPYENGITILVERRMGLWERFMAMVRYR